jgi:uncharacterized membrane protein (UPF0127 family)
MKSMKPVFAALLAAFALAGCQPSSDTAPTPPPATTATTTETVKPTPVANPQRKFQLRDLAMRDITAAGHTIHAWLMDTKPKQEEGMMFLKDGDVKDDEGMLFVFADLQPITNGFWMHNTILPLDIIYLASDGRVLNIQEGKSFDETSLRPAGAYLYTLELKQGEAGKLGIKKGTKVEIPSDITSNE